MQNLQFILTQTYTLYVLGKCKRKQIETRTEIYQSFLNSIQIESVQFVIFSHVLNLSRSHIIPGRIHDGNSFQSIKHG